MKVRAFTVTFSLGNKSLFMSWTWSLQHVCLKRKCLSRSVEEAYMLTDEAVPPGLTRCLLTVHSELDLALNSTGDAAGWRTSLRTFAFHNAKDS